MAGFKYERFVGQFPARSKRLLAANAAVVARDMRLGNGEILPLHDASFEYSFSRPATPAEAHMLQLSNPGSMLVDTLVVGDSYLTAVSPELSAADWASATTPASIAFTPAAETYTLENSAGAEYSVTRASEPGALLWDRTAPLALEVRLLPWARDYEDAAESYADAGAKQFFFRGARPLGDGVIARVEASVKYLPDVAGETVIEVRFKHWVDYPHDGVYANTAADVWTHTVANYIADVLVAEIREPTDLLASRSVTLQLVPDGNGDVTLLAYDGTDLVGEYLDRSGRTVSIPGALFPRYFDTHLRVQGVDVHTTPNSQVVGFAPAAAGGMTAPAPGGYPEVAGVVAPFDLTPRTVDGGGVTRQYLLDAYFDAYPIPAADGVAAGWDRYLPFDNTLGAPVDFGVVGAFTFGDGVSEALQSPVYVWRSAVSFLQERDGGDFGDIALDVGALQDVAGGVLVYDAVADWPFIGSIRISRDIIRQGTSWIEASTMLDAGFNPSHAHVSQVFDAGVTDSYAFHIATYGIPTRPSAVAADASGGAYMLVFPAVNGVDTNNVVGRGGSGVQQLALTKGAALCELRAALDLPSPGGFVVGGVDVIAVQSVVLGPAATLSFALATTPAGAVVNRFCHHGGVTYAACDGGVVLISDATRMVWTSVATGVTTDLKGIASDGTTLVAVGAGRTILVSTDDGVTWDHAAKVGTYPYPLFGGSDLQSVAYGDGMWVTTPSDGGGGFYGTSTPAGEWYLASYTVGASERVSVAYGEVAGVPTFAMSSVTSGTKTQFFTGVSETLYPGVVPVDTRTPIVFQWSIEDYGTAAEESAIERVAFRIEGVNDDALGDAVTAWAELSIEVMDDMASPELEVSLSYFRETPAGVVVADTSVLGRVTGWTVETRIVATMVLGGRIPTSPVGLTPGDLSVDVNGTGTSVGWLAGEIEAASSPSPGVPTYFAPSVKVFETRSSVSYAPAGAVTPVLTFNSEGAEVEAFDAHGGSVANMLSVEQALDENSVLLQAESSSQGLEARTIHRLSRQAEDGEPQDFWIRILPDADFVGQLQEQDIHGRLYWAAEGHGVRVDTLDRVYFNSSNVGLNIQQGFPVGVPAGDELITSLTMTRVAPTAEQYEISHAALVKVPAFNANILEGSRVITARPEFGGQAVFATQRAVSYPETYYLLVRTTTQDTRPPLTLAHETLLQFNPAARGVGLEDLDLSWANIARDSQERAFHAYPRSEVDTAVVSEGVKLVDPDVDFAGFPAGTLLLQAIRSTQKHPLDPMLPIHAGVLADTEYPDNAGTGLTKVAGFFRTAVDTSIPANWRFVADRTGLATKTEALLPASFEPVLITDPEKVFARLYSRLFSRYRSVRWSGRKMLFPEVTFAAEGTSHETPLTEDFLNGLWVFQVDAATYASLGAGGVTEFLPGTHFTQATPAERWAGTEALHYKPSNRKWRAQGNSAVTYPRGLQALSQGTEEYTATLVDDEWTTGPLLIDPNDSIDWSAAALTTNAYLEFDPAFTIPGAFDPNTEPQEEVEYAFTPVNIYGEEGPPSFGSVSRYSAYPLAPITTTMSFAEAVSREFRITGVNIYRLEEDGIYYFIRHILLPAEGAGYSQDIVLGMAVDMNRPLVSLNFDRPPGNASVAIKMSNGALLIGSGRELFASEPGFPHAYPRQYKLELDFDIVGFGSFGDTVVACTTGQPYLVAGDNAAALSEEKLDLDQACISRGSIVSMSGQVIYASREGLFSVGRGGIRHLTAGIVDTAAWGELNPETFHAHNWDGKYLCFFQGDREDQAFMLDPEQLEQGLTFYSQSASAGFSEIEEPGFYFLDNGVIYEWDSAGDDKVWTWGSRFTRRTRDGNPGRVKIQCSKYPVTFSLWVDNKHHICKEWTVLDDTAVALPSGLLGEEYYLRLKGTGDLITVEFGDTIYDIQKG